MDDDLYLMLGRAQPNVDEELLARTHQDMRDLLAHHPTMIELMPDDVSIVAYADPTLPPGASVTLKLPVDEARLTALYV